MTHVSLFWPGFCTFNRVTGQYERWGNLVNHQKNQAKRIVSIVTLVLVTLCLTTAFAESPSGHGAKAARELHHCLRGSLEKANQLSDLQGILKRTYSAREYFNILNQRFDIPESFLLEMAQKHSQKRTCAFVTHYLQVYMSGTAISFERFANAEERKETPKNGEESSQADSVNRGTGGSAETNKDASNQGEGDLSADAHGLVRAYYVNRDNDAAKENLKKAIGNVREKNKNAVFLPDPNNPNFHDLMLALAETLGLTDEENSARKVALVYGNRSQELSRFDASISVTKSGFETDGNFSIPKNGEGATEGIQIAALNGGSNSGGLSGSGLAPDRLRGLDRADQVAQENGQSGRDNAKGRQERR